VRSGLGRDLFHGVERERESRERGERRAWREKGEKKFGGIS
jgi:hypothetical protein